MSHPLNVSYENMGQSSYLVMGFPPGVQVVPYQLEMISSNQIAHFLSVIKRVKDGELFLYYEISSKISLEQILSRRKLKKEELICLIEGLLLAIKDSSGYQLSESGITLETEYIYVDPVNCDPVFAYLPIDFAGGKGIKALIMELITQSKIEVTNDNFVQLLLETVNNPGFTMNELEVLIKKFKGNLTGQQTFGYGSPRNDAMAATSPVPVVSPVGVMPEIHPAMPVMPAVSAPMPVPLPPIESVQPQKPEKKKRAARNEKMAGKKMVSQSEEGGFDAEKAKKKFILPQAPIMIIVCAMISFGAFIDSETGELLIKNILATVLVVGVTEIILYREAYVNSKAAPTAKKKKAGNSSGSHVARPTLPGKGSQSTNVEPTSAATAVPSSQPHFQSQLMMPGGAAAVPHPAVPPHPTVASYPTVPYPTAVQHPVAVPYQSAAAEDMGATIGLDQAAITGSYLEYYENGQMSRIPLDKESILVGRLASTVDFAISNPRVGKIHAEFICQKGNYFVRDLNSRNGTFINGQRISSNILCQLNPNDKITLANSDLILRCSG